MKFDKKTLAEWKSAGIKDISCIVVPGGCAGNRIKILTEKDPSTDISFSLDNGISVWIKKSESDIFLGSSITQRKSGWIISHENAINRHCGCGKSFSLKGKTPLEEKLLSLKMKMKEKREGACL